MDGTGRYSFTGLFNRRPAFSLAVFESLFYWIDDKGLWQVPPNQPNQRKFLWKAELPLLTVYHELQQPQGTSWILSPSESPFMLEVEGTDTFILQ